MNVVKTLLAVFLSGGLLSVVGQVCMNLFVSLLGPGSPLVGALTLVSMGFIGCVLFIAGLYQKFEKFGGFGTIMPFSGLAAGIGSAFVAVQEEGGSTGAAIKAGLMVVVYVLGSGIALSAIIGTVAFFVGN